MSPQYIAHDDFALEARETLRVYRWGDQDMNHYFCATCGIFPFSDVIAPPGRYRVNLGCVDAIDVDSLHVELIDGQSL